MKEKPKPEPDSSPKWPRWPHVPVPSIHRWRWIDRIAMAYFACQVAGGTFAITKLALYYFLGVPLDP